MANIEPHSDAVTAGSVPPKPDAIVASPAAPESVPAVEPPDPADNCPTVISKARRQALDSLASPGAGMERGTPPDAKNFADCILGRRLGHFELEETLGIGGMAAVIRARDTLLDRQVALKILPPEMAGDPENVRRFENEAKAAAKLDHENIARVFFCGADQGLHFIAFEYVEGANLRLLMEKRGGRLPVADAIHYTLQIATGLVHAGERGVIHRDIKPSNIIVTADGRAKLVDMGLARSQAKLTSEELTHSGVTLGTFDYISPEQAMEPRNADVRSDIYSLGCTLYHLLTGQPPVPEGTAARKLQFHQNEAPLDPRQLNPEIPNEVAAIIGRMIAKDPKERYQRPEELIPHLIAVAEREPINRSEVYSLEAILPSPPRVRLLPVLVTAAFAVAVLIAGLALLESSPMFRPREPADLSARPREPREGITQSGRETTNPPAENPALPDLPAIDTSIDVRSARELRDWVARGGAGVLQLDSLYYDLVTDDAGTESPAGLVWSGGELVIQAKPGAAPTIRLTGRGGSGLATEQPAILVNGGRVTVRGVRFVLDPAAGNAPLTALAVNKGQLSLDHCEFVQKENGGGSGLAVLKVLAHSVPASDVGRAAPPQIEFQDCSFDGGQNGILVHDVAKVVISHCRFGPYLLPIQLRDRSMDSRGASLTLRDSTCLLWPRPFLDISSADTCSVTLERSVFSAGFENRADSGDGLHPSQATLVLLGREQEKDRVEFHGAGNYYHNLTALVGQTTENDGVHELVREVADFSRFASWRDFGSQKGSESPWQEADPWRALREGRSLADLRLRPGWSLPPAVAATPPSPIPGNGAAVPPASGESTTVRPSVAASNENSIREVVVDGKGLATGTYRNLATALTDTQGDVIITVKIDGRLESGSLDILGARRVHIRAAAPFRPELTLNPDAVPGADGETALFRVHDGELILDGLAFKLQPTLKEAPKLESVLSVTGVGHAKMKDCLATLAGDGSPRMAMIAIADPTGSMMGTGGKAPRAGTPAVEIEDCFVRGTGDMVTVRVSRPYRLEARNVLVVLGGSLLSEEGNKSEAMMSTEGASIALDRVTAVVSQNLIVLRTTPANPIHVPVHISPATTCVFAAAEGGPLVSIDGPQSETELKRWLTWSGKRNVYSTSGSILVWQPLEKADMPHKYDGDRWNDLWGRDDDEPRFARDIKFAGYPAALKTRAEAIPDDFRILAAEGQEKELAGRGADIEKLPKPSTETTKSD